jgi:hypothetical protein
MTSDPPPADAESERASVPSERGSHLKRVRLRGSALAWAVPGAGVSALGLLLVTGLSNTPWLFLLYPLLIGALLVSLGMIVLHLLQRL